MIVSADWTRDGLEIVTCASGGKIRIWDVSPAGSSVEELTRQAELLAARRLDPQIGIVPLTSAEMQARWRQRNK